MVMDDALVAAIVKRGVYVMGNLSSPRKSTYASLPQWLSPGDPMTQLLGESVSAPALDRLRAYFASAIPQAVEGARQRYAILEQSLAKLNRAGAKIILGADTGLEDHLFGMAEQLELEAMVDAGMTPAQGDRRRDQPVGGVPAAEEQGCAAARRSTPTSSSSTPIRSMRSPTRGASRASS